MYKNSLNKKNEKKVKNFKILKSPIFPPFNQYRGHTY